MGSVLLVAAQGAPQQGQAPMQGPPPALIARGDSVFHGKLGGAICFTCHGQRGVGAPGMGPSLADAVWLHGDGSMAFLRTTIRAGVAKAKQSAIVMPPFGGTPLDSAKLEAVAAYVYSLSHR